MRVFDTLKEAALEIKRDLAKSPAVGVSRVQQFSGDWTTHEAMLYSYTVKNMESLETHLRDGVGLGFYKVGELDHLRKWYSQEMVARTEWRPGYISEKWHPSLMNVLEGNEPSYSYTDRLDGMVKVLANSLRTSEDSRRAFWPMFNQEDARRASRNTRIPCTIGYQAMIRKVEGDPFLHLVYLERSCDFDRFWYSDIWLARFLQVEILHLLNILRGFDGLEGVQLGYTGHVITSLHSFIDEEVY